MAEEIQEAVQIIRVAYDGIDIVMKVGSGGIQAMQKVLECFRGMLDYEKSIGQTSMRKLLMKGGDLQVFQFKTEDIAKIKKLMKKYGILYSVLPDINKGDGMSEIVFHSEAVPRINMMIQKLKSGRIATFDDYLMGGDEKQIDKMMKFFEGQKKGNTNIHTEEAARVNAAVDSLIEKVGMFAMESPNVSVDSVKEKFSIGSRQAEEVIEKLLTMGVLAQKDEMGNHKVLMDKNVFLQRIRGYQDLTERMKVISSSKDRNLVDVTISKTLIVKENETAVKTRIPGTWGDKERYIWIHKDNIIDVHGGKSMLTFLDRSKEYKIYDAENRVVETKMGEVLYSQHYDKVEAEIRKRYEKIQRKAKTSALMAERKR